LPLQDAVQAGFQQFADRALACLYCGAIPQGLIQPTCEQPGAHRRVRAVEQGEQATVPLAAQSAVQLQILPGDGIEQQCPGAGFPAQAGEMSEVAAIAALHVGEQGPGSRESKRQIVTAETGQIPGPEMLGQDSARRNRVEVPFGQALAARKGAGETPSGTSSSTGSRRASSAWSSARLATSRTLKRPLANSRIARPTGARSRSATPGADGDDQVGSPGFEQGLLGNGTGGDHPNHLALHRALACADLASLFADGYRNPLLQQPCKVGLHRVDGYARHGNRLTRGFAPAGEGDVEQFCGALRILVEQLVEISHAVEQEDVRVLRLDAQILLHHRGMSLEWILASHFGRIVAWA
jgi:hypothetical protein